MTQGPVYDPEPPYMAVARCLMAKVVARCLIAKIVAWCRIARVTARCRIARVTARCHPASVPSRIGVTPHRCHPAWCHTRMVSYPRWCHTHTVRDRIMYRGNTCVWCGAAKWVSMALIPRHPVTRHPLHRTVNATAATPLFRRLIDTRR